jgi:hypothetical protein
MPVQRIHAYSSVGAYEVIDPDPLIFDLDTLPEAPADTSVLFLAAHQDPEAFRIKPRPIGG